MRLDFEQICSISQGAVRFVETNSGICFYRFTKEQEEIYRQTKADFYYKTLTSAGMKLCFETDSRNLFLRVNVTPGSTRQYFSFDVKVDDRLVGYLDNFSDVTLPRDYTQVQLPQGEFYKTFALGEGIKKVSIYLPWSVAVEIRELTLEDGAFIKPIKPTRMMLVFGDSITQGYDALRPSRRYAAKLSEALDAEEINKAIGGEIFFPALAKSRDDFEPNYVTVAYGTNDWSGAKEEDFQIRCNDFFEALSSNYPKAKIFAITPIWCKDFMETKTFGAFHKVAENIQHIVGRFDNITCIHGLGLVPQNENYFADLWLHPNDSGFEFYFQNLYAQMRHRV